MQIVISDDQSGLCAAIRAVLNGVTWQRRMVHYLRNVLALLPRNAQALAAAAFRMAFMQSTMEAARERFGKAVKALEGRHPATAQCARDAEDDVLAYMTFPAARWCQIRSTNPLKRTKRSVAAPTWWASSRTTRRSCASWPCCWSSKTTSCWRVVGTSASSR